MAQSYELANGFSISSSDDGILIENESGKRFYMENGKVTRDENGKRSPLTSAEIRNFYQDLLRAEFFLPNDLNIQSLNIKKNSESELRLQLQANGGKKDTAKIDLHQANGETEFKRSMTLTKPTKQGVLTTRQTLRSFANGTDREYSDSTLEKERIHSEDFYTEHSTSLSRNIKNKGRRIVLVSDVHKLEDDGFVIQHDVKNTFDISTDAIEKNTTTNDDKYKKKLSLNYDLKTGKIQCRLRKREYEAIVITEYKATILTYKTGKKVKVDTLIDRDFDAQLTLNADGSFRYTQEQTAPDGSLEKMNERENLQKVASEILQEVEKIKAVASKVAVLKNSQHNPEHVNFALNPSVFDEEIKFSLVKDDNAGRLTDALMRGDAGLHRQLLASLQSISAKNDLTFNRRDGNQL